MPRRRRVLTGLAGVALLASNVVLMLTQESGPGAAFALLGTVGSGVIIVRAIVR